MMHVITRAMFLDKRRGLYPHELRVRHSRRLCLLFLVLAVLLGSTSVVQAAIATWNPNPEPDIAGYILSYGTQAGVHPTSIDVGSVTTWQVTTLTPGQIYYFVVQAYDTSGLTSVDSAEVVLTDPVATAPGLTSLAPTTGAVGIAVTIAGANFGATQGSSTVTFNGTSAVPTNWSAASIVVPVPSATTTGSVVVTVGGVASNGLSFTVNQPPTLTQPNSLTSPRNATVSIQLIASDPDGDALTYSATGLPAPLTVNAATGLISGTLASISVGTHTVTATVSDGTLSASQTFTWTVTNLAPALSDLDFDGDGKTDVAVYRPSSGTWEILQSSTNYTTSVAFAWGISTDLPVPGDYDGDGKTDLAIYRPTNRTWYVLLSSTNYTTGITVAWGRRADVPVPGDYDGDGKTDLAVYRPSNGTWHILESSTNYATSVAYAWGTSGDRPVPGDYDGDGKTDLAVYRPSSGTWRILESSTNYTTSVAYAWGTSTDIPVPGDYDGDGKTDLTVYRPSTGTWYLSLSSTNYTTSRIVPWGSSTAVPVFGDYDGDGEGDLAVFESGDWQILLSSSNYASSMATSWGLSTDVPLPKHP